MVYTTSIPEPEIARASTPRAKVVAAPMKKTPRKTTRGVTVK